MNKVKTLNGQLVVEHTVSKTIFVKKDISLFEVLKQDYIDNVRYGSDYGFSDPTYWDEKVMQWTPLKEDNSQILVFLPGGNSPWAKAVLEWVFGICEKYRLRMVWSNFGKYFLALKMGV